MGDLRLGEGWTPGQRLRNGLWYRAAMLALAGASGLPRRWLPAAGRALGTAAYVALSAERNRVRERLQRAFGEPPLEPIEVFRGLGEDLADSVKLLNPREHAEDGLELSEDFDEQLRAALAEGRGVVFATAHLGRLERMGARMASGGHAIATLARESYDPRFTAMVERLRAGRGVRTIYRGRPGAERAIVKALRDGMLVGFPMDLAGRGMACRRCFFLGQAQGLPVGPARIALRTGACLMVGTPGPGPGGRMVATVRRLETGSGADEQDVMQELASELDRRIRALPAHWPWMHRGPGGLPST